MEQTIHVKGQYNYTLIISQYYHDYHYFIVKTPNKENYIDVLRKFTIQLVDYKSSGEEKDNSKGDPFYYSKKDEIRERYNVNSYGDIYFINFYTANGAMEKVRGYEQISNRAKKGYKKKYILEAIENNHDYYKIRKIVEEYFCIA